MHSLCLSRGGGQSGTDGPDGFVGDGQARQVLANAGCGEDCQLRLDHGQRVFGLALLQALAHTQTG